MGGCFKLSSSGGYMTEVEASAAQEAAAPRPFFLTRAESAVMELRGPPPDGFGFSKVKLVDQSVEKLVR